MIQWGHLVKSSGSAGYAFNQVTFPHKFSTKCGAVISQWLNTRTSEGNMQGIVKKGSVTTTGCQISFWWDINYNSCYWVAVGK